MKKILLYTFLILFGISVKAQSDKADVSGIQNKYLDIPYATVSASQKLDIYLPDEGEGPFPVLISIHGGGFESGDKGDRMVEPMLNGLDRGYAVVSINYRLSGEATWPAQIYDCKAAVRWLRAHAATYNLNTGKIAVWGGSAGGHLAAMLGTTGGVSQLEDLQLGNPDQSSRIQAVVDWFGPTNFLTMDDQLKESGAENPMHHSIPGSPESRLLGKNIEKVPERVKEADPVTWVSPDDPPFFIQHGTEDNLVPYQGSVILARKLGKTIGYNNVHLELFPATGHGNGPAFYTRENMDKIFSFLDKHIKETEKGSITIEGYKLGYTIEGEGTPCLVIGSAVYYPRTFSEVLRKHLKMYFVDMPWFASERGDLPTASFTVKKINAFIEEIRQHFGLEKPILMGHSIHGTVAMEYAKQYPEHVSALIMIGSPNIYGNDTFVQKETEAWKRASEIRKELQKKKWGELAQKKDQFSPSQLIIEEYCTMGPTYWNNPYYDAHKLWEGMTIQADLLHYLYDTIYHNYFMFKDRLSAPVPTLVFLGKQDYAIPVELWKIDQDVANLNTIVMSRSGHTPQLEEQILFDRKLLNWLFHNALK